MRARFCFKVIAVTKPVLLDRDQMHLASSIIRMSALKKRTKQNKEYPLAHPADINQEGA